MSVRLGLGIDVYRGGSVGASLYSAYQTRVLSDSGNIDESEANLISLLNQLNGAAPNFTNTCKLLLAPHLGNKAVTGTGATAGNRAASKLYNVFGATGDTVQDTAASQPLLLRQTGEVYAFNSGITGNGFSTPSVVANQLVDNFGIECKINLPDLNTFQVLDARYNTTTTQQYSFLISGNTLILRMYNGIEFNVTSASITAFSGTTWWARVSRNSTTGVVKFFTSTNGTTFTQLGTDQISVTGTLSIPTIDRRIGAYRSSFIGPLLGQIFYSKIFKDDTFTTPTQIFNPADYNRSVSQTTFRKDLLSEVYTINIDTNPTGLKAMVVDKGMVVGNGTSYAMQAPNFAFNSEKITHYKVYRKFNNSVLSISSAIGNNAGGANGYYLANNEGSNNTVGVSVFGNVINGRNYTDNSLLMRIITSYADTTLSNPETDHYINNAQATPVSQINTGNNTSGINTTGFNLMANNNGASLWSNEVVFCELIFEGVHDTDTRTAVVNILKSYFNLP